MQPESFPAPSPSSAQPNVVPPLANPVVPTAPPTPLPPPTPQLAPVNPTIPIAEQPIPVISVAPQVDPNTQPLPTPLPSAPTTPPLSPTTPQPNYTAPPTPTTLASVPAAASMLGSLPISKDLVKKLKNKKSLLIGAAVSLALVTIGSAYAVFANKTDYQIVVQKFVIAVQKKDKAVADSLQSPEAKGYYKKQSGNPSFYEVCKQSGDYCTDYFDEKFLGSAVKTYKSYVSKNGTKGEQVIYTVKKILKGSQAGGQLCDSTSTSTMTISVVPRWNSWAIDLVDQGFESNHSICPPSLNI